MMDRADLLIWTENYWIGGCDRFLVDLISGLSHAQVRIVLAGNTHPQFDLWLSQRVPEILPRDTLPIANLGDSSLHRLEDALRSVMHRSPPSSPSVASDEEPQIGGPLARRAAVAALRYAQAGSNLLRLRGLMRRHRPQVLLINNGGYPGGESCRVAALAARAEGVEKVLHFVHNMAFEPTWPAAIENRLDRRIDRATDQWITAAQRASAALAAQRAIGREGIRTVHYGIAPPPEKPELNRPAMRAELGYGDDALALAVVANMEPRKGLAVLLEALARLRARHVEVRVALVGDGPERRTLEAQAEQLGLSAATRFLGWRDDVDDILSASDALALPSLGRECLPYVILEAMSHRLPVVSTDVAGIPEMVLDGVSGHVVRPGDSEALADALARVADSPDYGRAMGERGRGRLLDHFTLDRMTRNMSELIGLPHVG